MPLSRTWVVISLLVTAGCPEPKGTAVALTADETKTRLVERYQVWRDKQTAYLGIDSEHPVWMQPEGLSSDAQLNEALYCGNQAITLAEECNRDPESSTCIMQIPGGGLGGSGIYMAAWRLALADDLVRKSQVMLALKQKRFAVRAADDSLRTLPTGPGQKARGDALYAQGKFAEAFDAYAAAVKQKPKPSRLSYGKKEPWPDAYLSFLQGMCKAKANDAAAAKELISTALAAQPDLRDRVPGGAEVAAALGL